MPGFDNGVMFAKNVDFTDSAVSSGQATVLLDGQLLIGSATLPNIKVGFLTSTGGTVTVTNGSGTIDLAVSGTVGQTITTADTNVVPPTLGNWNLLGGTVLAGSTPITTAGTIATSTLTINAQFTQAIAATDATKVGLCAFDSAKFAVDANGFVTTAGGGVVITLEGDTGGPQPPVLGNFKLVGGPGVTTESNAVGEVKFFAQKFTDVSALPATLSSNNGYFIAIGGVATLPAAPAQGDIITVCCDTTAPVTITCQGTQQIRLGNQITAVAGNIASTAIGNSVTLRYRAATTEWLTVASMGNWTIN